jgi:predicted RNA-binding Zn ribbon-like protein
MIRVPEVTDQVDFTHYTDAPVQLAVDLVNTRSLITGRDDLDGPDGLDALRRFLDEHDHACDELGPGDLEAARSLRESLRAVFQAPDADEAAAQLNRTLTSCDATPRVSVHGKHGPHLHFESLQAGTMDRLAATTAMALSVVLCEFGFERFGVCDSTTCNDAYIDSSRNCRKRYCSDGCAHRESVAAFRARKKAGA